MAPTDPALELVTFLAASSLGLTVGTNIFYSRLPDQPDAAVAIFSTGGIAPLKGMLGQSGADVKVSQPTFQVRVRGAREGYAAAMTLAYNILSKLQPVVEQTIVTSGLTWLSLWAMQDPTSIGIDEKQRPEIVTNYTARVSNPAGY